MLGPVQPTSMDLQFHLFGMPVRVLPWFWLLAIILGYPLIDAGWQYLVVWVVVVFFSILAHELGHALVARALGYPPRIVLYHFGGLAMFTPDSRYTSGKAILILLAGPGAGLLLGLLTIVTIFGLAFTQTAVPPLAEFTFDQMVWVNIGWTILNLLPILPLDGGQITREVCTSMRPNRGEVWALYISIVAAVCVAFVGFTLRDRYLGFLFLFIAYQNFQELQARRYWR